MNVKKEKIKNYIFLHIILIIFYFCSVFSKLAGQSEFLSFEFCIFYGISIAILGIYAIFWQQILKRFSLTVAFINKAITIVWGILWGAMFFKEQITTNMIIGAVIVFVGVSLVVMSDE